MKTLFGSILVIAVFFATFEPIQAQTTVMGPAVAFVKASRDSLFIQPLSPSNDSPVQAYDLASIVTTITFGNIEFDSLRQIAVIGMTPAGDRLVIGGTLYYYNTASSAHTKFQGLMSIPWPLTINALVASPPILLLPTPQAANFRPEGVLSADGKQWWAVMSSTSQATASLTFYHGNTDGTGKIDSSTFATVLNQGFHMSNIAIDKTNNTMVATIYDALADADPIVDAKVYYMAWNASSGNPIEGTDFTGSFNSLNSTLSPPKLYRTDSLFGLTIIPANDGVNAYIGLTPSSDNSINLYQLPYFSASVTLTNQSYTISRSVIPSTENFFSGKNCGAFHEIVLGPGISQLGNGADVSVNSIGGDSVLFITHDANDECDNSHNEIWYYDYKSGNNSATMVYNDPNSQELQPVWVVAPYTLPVVPHYPGVNWASNYSGDFGSLDTGKTGSLSFTFSDTSQATAVVIDSVTISGTNASEFAITSGPITKSMQPGVTQKVTVGFTPVIPAGTVSATLTVYFEGQTPNMSLTQSLTGNVTIPLDGVKEDALLAASMSVEPNPFSSSASVQLTVPASGALGIVVHDALGRTVYTSDIRETGAGQTQSFAFDAKALGLPDGVYYVTAFLGERQASRAVVFVR